MHTHLLFFQHLITILQNSLENYSWQWEFSETSCIIFTENLQNNPINNQYNFCYFIDYQGIKNIELGLQFFENTSFSDVFCDNIQSNFEYYVEQIKLQKLQKRYTTNPTALKITNNAMISQLMIENLSIEDLAAHLRLILQQIHSDFIS